MNPAIEEMYCTPEFPDLQGVCSDSVDRPEGSSRVCQRVHAGNVAGGLGVMVRVKSLTVSSDQT